MDILVCRSDTDLAKHEVSSAYISVSLTLIFNPLSPKIDFMLIFKYVQLLGQVTTNSCYFQKYFKKLIIYDNISPCPFKRLKGYVFFFQEHIIQL